MLTAVPRVLTMYALVLKQNKIHYQHQNMQDKNKKAELSQRWPRDAPGPYM